MVAQRASLLSAGGAAVGMSGAVLIGALFALGGAGALAMNLRSRRGRVESKMAFAAMRVFPPLAILFFGLVVFLFGFQNR